MASYITQLLEDIALAQKPENIGPTFGGAEPQTIEDEFAEIERWIEHEPEHTFSYYCRLEKEQFPPAEKLTIKQVQQITEALMHLLFTWNLSADIPENIPPQKKYTLLMSVLNKKTDIVSSGFMTFEFCNYDPPSCLLKNIVTVKILKIIPMAI